MLDVKVGDGAFMKTLEDARLLAEMMLVARRAGGARGRLPAHRHGPAARRAVGNALEVREALATVRGNGPAGLHRARLDASARLLALSDLGIDELEGRRRVEAAVADGSADAAWRAWIEAQGGTADEAALPVAPVIRPVDRAGRGYVRRLGAMRVGNAALHLGAGRRTKDDEVDHAVGVVCHAKRGDRVEAGGLLAEIHARDDASGRGGRRRGARGVRARRRSRPRIARAARSRRLKEFRRAKGSRTRRS